MGSPATEAEHHHRPADVVRCPRCDATVAEDGTCTLECVYRTYQELLERWARRPVRPTT